MRNFLLLILVLLLPASLSAQQLIKNDAHSDGTRDILTMPMEIYSTYGHGATVALSYTSIPIDGGEYAQYMLFFTLSEGEIEVNEGRKMLVKFSDDSIMELSNSQNVNFDDCFAVETHSGTEWNVVVIYHLTEEQLQELVSKRAVKLRIETNTRILDREIKDNKMSKNLGTLYTLILNTLLKNKDFYSDF